MDGFFGFVGTLLVQLHPKGGQVEFGSQGYKGCPFPSARVQDSAVLRGSDVGSYQVSNRGGNGKIANFYRIGKSSHGKTSFKGFYGKQKATLLQSGLMNENGLATSGCLPGSSRYWVV